MYFNTLTKLFTELIGILEEKCIKYFVTAWTLLGKLRHTNYIPWDDDDDVDDDVDICVFIEDYDKLSNLINHYENMISTYVGFQYVKKSG